MSRFATVVGSFAVALVTAPAAANPAFNSADLVFWACVATFLIAAEPYATKRAN